MNSSRDRVAHILSATDDGRSVYEQLLEVTIEGRGKDHLKNPAYDDSNGSLSVYLGDSGRWLHHDHGNSDYKGDCFDFYAQRYDFDIRSQFAQMLTAMEQEFNVVDIDWATGTTTPVHTTKSRRKYVERRKQTEFIDLNFIARRRNEPDVFTSWFHGLLDAPTFARWSQGSTVCSDPRGPQFVLFSYVDLDGCIRGCKRVMYVQGSEDRFHHGTTYNRHKNVDPMWVNKQHGIEKWSQVLYNLQRIDRSKPVYVVESEKTAEIGTVWCPKNNWVATGGSEMLREPALRDIGDLPIILVPDTNKLSSWTQFAQDLDGQQPDGVSWTYNIQCWADWHVDFPHLIDPKKGEDIGDLMQCFAPSEFVKASGLF